MQFENSLDLLLVHAQGEIGRVIIGGAPEIPGATILDKMNHINMVDDSLRRFVSFEPRAGVAMSTNLLLSPTRPDADAAFIVLQPDRAHPMSGSNCICVVTALLESGRVAMVEPETTVRLDTAAGLIVARARCENGRCVSVSLDNVPAFVLALDAPVQTKDFGMIRADIAFGGVFYALVDADQIGLAIVPDNARALAEAEGARQVSVTESTGQAQRFLSVLRAYEAAKDVTMQRLYLETMQTILSTTPSIIVDDRLDRKSVV